MYKYICIYGISDTSRIVKDSEVVCLELEQVQKRWLGLEQSAYEERLREWDFFNMEKRRFGGT